MDYLLLQHPGHNRVYYNAAGKLALSELQLASKRLSVSCTNICTVEVAKIRYLSLCLKDKITKDDLEILSRLSFVFAIFEQEEVNGENYLRPIQIREYEYMNSKIGSILKYQGKTNELFTKMMINIALLSSDFNYTDSISLLDPVSGKGTTLFEASVYGYNAYGVEQETKSVHEAAIFFKKYLEKERIKHATYKRQVSGTSKKNAVLMNEFQYALTKQEFKLPETSKKMGFVCGSTENVAQYFKNNQFHILVGDLPYGIVHGNMAGRKNTTITRNPSELLTECLPHWYKVLKKGGVVVVAWNSFLAGRTRLATLFSKYGFEVLDSEPYQNFEHMVDKSIKRDIVVARKN